MASVRRSNTLELLAVPRSSFTALLFMLAAAPHEAIAELGSKQVSGNAGLLAHACVGREARYLIALEKDSSRGWGHLGGTPEPSVCTSDRCEPELATAIREFYEESNCTLRPDAGLPTRISGPSVVQAESHRFATYAMQVGFVEIDKIKTSQICKTAERVDWAWVSHGEMLRFVSAGSTLTLRPLDWKTDVRMWNRAAESLREARKDGLIPDADPCGR